MNIVPAQWLVKCYMESSNATYNNALPYLLPDVAIAAGWPAAVAPSEPCGLSGAVGLPPSATRLAATLWAEYTWLSNSLYMPKVAVQTVHLYERCAGLSVSRWSFATWCSNFHWYTRPHTGHRPASLPLLAASCIALVTRPWVPSKCRSRPWSVKNLKFHTILPIVLEVRWCIRRVETFWETIHLKINSVKLLIAKFKRNKFNFYSS